MRPISVLTTFVAAGLLAASPAPASKLEGVCETVERSVPKALFWLEKYARSEAPAKREQAQADLQRLTARCRVGRTSRDELLRLAELVELAAGLAPLDEKRHSFDRYELGYCVVLLREAASPAGEEAPGPAP